MSRKFEIMHEHASKYGHVLYGECVVNWSGAGWYAPASHCDSNGEWFVEYYHVGSDASVEPETYTMGLGTPAWYDGYEIVA